MRLTGLLLTSSHGLGPGNLMAKSERWRRYIRRRLVGDPANSERVCGKDHKQIGTRSSLGAGSGGWQ